MKPLADPIKHLSASFTDLVAATLKTPELGAWITGLGEGVETFSKTIGTPEFKKNVEDFAQGVGRFATAIWTGIKWINDHLPAGVVRLVDDIQAPLSDKEQSDADAMQRTRFGESVGDRQTREQKEMAAWRGSAKTLPQSWADVLIDHDAQNEGVPKDFARAIFKLEGGLNQDGSARISRAGAIGAGQLMPGTALGLNVNPFDTADNISGSVRLQRQLLTRYGGDYEKAAAAYNSRPSEVDSDIRLFGDNWRDHLHDETKKYLAEIRATLYDNQDSYSLNHPSEVRSNRPVNHYHSAPATVNVQVTNATGGSAVVQAHNAAVQ